MRLAIGLVLTVAGFGQPAFDVASLKPGGPLNGDSFMINLGSYRNGEAALENASLGDCITFAWGLVSHDQVAGPDWIKDKTVRFDVVGKTSPGTPRADALLMMRTLLIERFHLEFHMEQRNFTHYVLVPGKSAPKMREVALNPAEAKSQHHFGHLVNNQMTMHSLALLLSRQMRILVLDETGLKGVYDIDLQWTPEGAAATDAVGPTIFTAVQEQLGLRLEGRKDSVEVMVVDRAERVPVAN